MGFHIHFKMREWVGKVKSFEKLVITRGFITIPHAEEGDEDEGEEDEDDDEGEEGEVKGNLVK